MNASKPYREIQLDGQILINETSFSNNRMFISPYTPRSFLFLAFLNQFYNIPFTYFISLATIEIYYKNQYSTFILLLFLIIYGLTKEFISAWWIWQIEKRIQLVQVKRWNGNNFHIINSQDLYVGNIIVVDKKAPADVVILAGEDKIGVFNSYVTEGEWKEPVKEIKKIVSLENTDFFGISKLFGTVEVDEANGNFGSFDGKIKLRGRPNSYKLYSKNVIYQGTEVNSKILGLVVYTGKDTKFSRSLNCTINSSFMNSKLSKISAVFVIILLIYMIISIIICFGFKNNESFQDVVIEYFIMYGDLVPISAFVIVEIVRVFNLVRFWMKFDMAKVNNLQSLENVAKTEIVAIDEECVVSEVVVAKYYVGDGIIDMRHMARDYGDTFTLTTERAEFVSFCRPETPINFQFWKLLLLATSAIKENNVYIGPKDEMSLLKTIEDLGFDIHIKTKDSINFSFDNRKYYFKIIQLNNYKSRTRIIVSSHTESYFLVQGYFTSIFPIFTEKTKEKPESICNNLISEGLRPYILCSKYLPLEAIKKITSKFDSLSHSLISQSKKIEKILSKLENASEFLGIVGLEDKILKETRASLSKLLSENIKIVVFSSRSKVKASSVLDVIDSPVIIPLIDLDNEVQSYRALWKFIIDVIYKLNSRRQSKRIDTIKELEESSQSLPGRYSEGEKIIANHKLYRKFSINPNIDFLKKTYKGEKRYTVMLDRVTLQSCMKSDNTKRLLTCVLYGADVIALCDMMPEDWVRVVKMLQENVKHKPVVLGIGNSKWALAVCQNSGIGVTTKKSLVGDISGLSLAQIPELISFCKASYSLTYFSIFWKFFNNAVLASFLLLFQSFTEFSGYLIFPNKLKILFNLITSIQLMSKNYSNPRILQYIIIGTILVGCVIVFGLITGYSMILENGRVIDWETMAMMDFVILTGSIIFLCFLENRSYYLGLLTIAILATIMAIYDKGNTVNSGVWMIQVTFGVLVCVSLPSMVYFIISRIEPVFNNRFPYNNFSEVYTSTQYGTSDSNSVKMHYFTMKFKEKHTEDYYKQTYIQESLGVIQVSIITVSIIILFWAILNLFLGDSKIETIIRFSCAGLFFLLFLTTFLTNYKRHYIRYTVLLSLTTAIAKFIAEITGNEFSVIASVMIPAVTYILFNVDWVYLTYVNTLSLIFSIITLSLYFKNASMSILCIIYSIFVLVSLTLFTSIFGYMLEKYYRNVFKLTIYIKKQVEKSLSILEILLPELVIDRVKAGVRYIADDQGEVTVLFCDICNFEQLCNEYQPNEFSALLDSVFSIFDELCENYGITKIETVGKTYMACSGLNKQVFGDSPCIRLAIDLALDMIRESKKINLKTGKLSVKIGINTGQVTAGVVGFHKPQFSLVGDTVNTASRMCSTLETSNSIQISRSTYDALENKDGIELTANKIFAKGKGEMETFLVKEGVFVEQKKEVSLLGVGGRTYKIMNWRQSVLQREDTEIIKSVWWLGFTETKREKEYRISKLESKYWSLFGGLAINCVLQIGLLVIEICSYTIYKTPIYGIILKSCIICIQIPLLFLHSKLYTKYLHQFLLILIIVLMLTNSILSISTWPGTISTLELCYIILFLNHMISSRILVMTTLNITLLFAWFLALGISSYFFISEFFLLIFFSVINLFSLYRSEKKHLKSYNLQVQANKEIRETEHLLVQMMPAHVVHSLSEGIPITEKLMDITILYADIVGFTAWSSGKNPKEVVQMLSNLFTEFDKKCVELNVYKVHTIGDCYVAMGYLSGQRDPVTECLNVFHMAQNMIDIIFKENQNYNMQLAMRIGIHTGDIIAGVIGNKVVRYDIWGTDVLIANKMESNGKSGEINVSESCKNILEGVIGEEYEFSFNKEIGKNPACKSYFVYRKIISEE
ncbi:hypothetical protein SteCoe_15383 [Stentor coeruleus]|uniref:Guanylate cyclase domain-containing protein n=1 Tax=Stentor coeruleus TaxID=5963 RepID=A0A1R2C3S2_9CILI|nr:hypothetical protein SteCoe_15383 [Stentor coeruleus]